LEEIQNILEKVVWERIGYFEKLAENSETNIMDTHDEPFITI
jgi:hypothetical protein